MKKLLILGLILLCQRAVSQPVLVPGSTNSATVILKPDTNNLLTVAASSMRNDSTNGPVFFGGLELPVVAGILASNSWATVLATNGMKNGDFRILNSNGVAQTSVWISNGVPIFKQLAP